MTRSRGIRAPRRYWTEEELAILRRDYPHMKTERIAAALSRAVLPVYQKAAQLGLKKTAEYLASAAACRLRQGDNIGAAHRFPKGHVPANKGLRRPGWAPGRMRETQFRKGERRGVAVRLYKPIGSERISKDGYLERKVNDDLPLQRRWKAVHRIVWEAENGPVPLRHAIAFKEGMFTNEREKITVDRLELVARAELARRNHWSRRLPKELQHVIHLRGAIKRKITMRERDGQHNR